MLILQYSMILIKYWALKDQIHKIKCLRVYRRDSKIWHNEFLALKQQFKKFKQVKMLFLIGFWQKNLQKNNLSNFKILTRLKFKSTIPIRLK